MEGLTITAVRLTAEAASRVLQTVLDAGHTYGLGYWGEVSNVRMKNDRIVSFDVTEHEPYTEQTEARRRRVTTAEIGPAVQRMLSDPEGCACRGVINQLLTDSVDGPLADCIVQVVCFGAVIYG
jgi:hypothetical protein